MSASNQHSIPADVEEAFGVLEKRLHPTWEIEGVQATAILRHHFEGLFEQLEVSQSALRELMIRARNLRDYDSDRAEHLLDLALEGAASALGRDSDLSGAFGAGNEPVADAASNPASTPDAPKDNADA